MEISKILALYPISFIIFLGVDMLWLGVIAKNMYAKYLGKFISNEVNWTAAIVFYLLFVAGVMIFAIIPGITDNSLKQLIIKAALFGLFTYATYELTNMATIKNWPLNIVIIDIIWGMALSTIVAVVTYFVYQKFF
jgi:uncharacterized membrane protein